jgi:hypothetical protein
MTDGLRKKDIEKNLGMNEYDMDGILRCTIEFRNEVVSIEFNSLSAKYILAGEKLVATYSIST